MVVNKWGAVTGELIAHGGVYDLSLPPSTNNTDPRHPDLYLVGGEPYLVVEKVSPLPDAVDAPIQVVWPHDGASPAAASQANVSAVLLLPGTHDPIPCRWSPTVRLMASVDGGAEQEPGSAPPRPRPDAPEAGARSDPASRLRGRRASPGRSGART